MSIKKREKFVRGFEAIILMTLIIGVVLVTIKTSGHKANESKVDTYDEISIKNDKDNIRKTLSGTHIASINETPIKNIYEVTAGKNVFYVDGKAHYAFFGHLYDLVNNKDLTPAITIKGNDKREQAKLNWQDLPLDKAIVTGSPDGIFITVFVDPDCPYCKKLESELLASNDFKVYQLLLPLDGIHEGASKVANNIMCAPNPEKAITDWFNKGNVPINSNNCMSQVNAIKAFADLHQINGTPVIVRQDGAVIFGYRPINEILAWAKGESNDEAS